MRAFVRWLRRVLPDRRSIATVLLFDLVFEFLELCERAQGLGPNVFFFPFLRLGLLVGSAFFYGLHRVKNFHPAANQAYWNWLELTPWTHRQPLPVGPLQLVIQDFLIISLLCVLYHRWSTEILYIPTAFLVGYQLALSGHSSTLGHWKLAYSIRFGLGFVALLIETPEYAFAAADACFIIGRVTVRHALKTFPWRTVRTPANDPHSPLMESLGWPYDQLSPRPPKIVVPRHHGILASLLVGWWWFIGLLKLNDPGYRTTAAFAACGLIAFICLGMIGHYRAWHQSPLSVLGRLRTFRLIIPSYDQIYVGPLVACVVCATSQIFAARLFHELVVPWKPQNFQWAIAISSLGITASLMILFATGPRLEYWRLMAQHRITTPTTAPFEEDL